MADHDQRFKSVLKAFFPDFMRLFFPDYAARLDLERIDWQPQEVFPHPPEGTRHLLDMVAKVHTREAVEPEHWLALIHVEIESDDKATGIRGRLARTSRYLGDQHGLPVLPLVVFLSMSLDGIGVDEYTERFWELEVFRFRYLYVALRGLDPVQYLESGSVLGAALSALMRVSADQAAWVSAEAFRQIANAPLNQGQRFMLAECVQTYLPLDAEQRREYERITAVEAHATTRRFGVTLHDEGVIEGKQKGRDEGRREALQDALESKFGTLSPETIQRVEQLSLERVIELTRRVVKVDSLAELGLADEEQP